MSRALVKIGGLGHRYGKVAALSDIDLTIATGGLTGFVGPDGVGKSTLLSIVAGVTKIQTGSVEVFGRDMAKKSQRESVCSRVGFMPQGLGQNLYGDLSVEENIRFIASLFEVPADLVDSRLAHLLKATELEPFSDRRARQLSGGMKQKLGLCAILIHEPDLLILDEPTTGVDPLSRRNFWRLIRDMVRRKSETTVLVATAYMEEAEDFDWLVMMNAARVIATGTPAALREQSGTASLDGAYESLISGKPKNEIGKAAVSRPANARDFVIEATDLTRRFGPFTAVDGVNFRIRRGEIYGFIGPNGSGKTTTMKMLTGLLQPSQGTARIFGGTVKAGSMELRRRLGYMSQLFSLYAELTVKQNLDLHGRLFALPPIALRSRVAELCDEFDLTDYLDLQASALPIGIRQRLSLAVAVIHRPELLILDEPTSGVDPLARDKIWEALRRYSDDDGTTIFVSTHYLSEAARCDRVALMNDGRLLVSDAPVALLAEKNVYTLDDAFIAYIQDDRARRQELLAVG